MTIVDAISALNEAPVYGELTGRDGLPCRVWQNPNKREFGGAIRRATLPELAGLRGLVTATDLYVWQSANLLHTDFEQMTGTLGIRVALRSLSVHVNDETVDQPEHFPWVFPDAPQAATLDIEDRRKIVETWLLANRRLKVIYPTDFTVIWYS